jgi:hypothetical protein
LSKCAQCPDQGDYKNYQLFHFCLLIMRNYDFLG